MDLRSIARALGGEVSNGQVIAPGPHHSPKDRSMWVRLSPQAPDGILTGSFCGNDWRDCKDLVRARLGLEGFGSESRDRPVRPTAPEPITCQPVEDDQAKARRALTVWNEAIDPRGTPVEAYLRSRGLDLLEEAANEAIRFHSACPFAGHKTPAMICLVRDIVTNEPKAIHRTALDRDGRAIEIEGRKRAALGPIGGGAIKLTPDEDVNLCLGIGEGLESTLSMRGVPEFGASPVWGLISAGGVSSFPVLSGIESLWIAVDHDPAGQKASRICAQRWHDAGREAFLIMPRLIGADLNDLKRGVA